MLTKLGVLYPTTGRYGDSHAGLAEAFRTGDHGVVHALSVESANWRTVLLSSENFSTLDFRSLRLLKRFFPHVEFRIAYTLRRLAALWPAHWAELVKHGQTPDFTDYLDLVAVRDETEFTAPVLPLLQLERLVQVFGRDAMRLMIYEARSGVGQDMGPAFIDDLLGLGQVASHFATTRVNVTASARETAMVRFLNLHIAGRASYAEQQKLRLALLAEIRERPPVWLAEFDASLGRARRLLLGSSHPLIASEQKAVVAQFGDLLLDEPEHFLQQTETEVPIFGPADLPPSLRITIAAFIDGLWKS